MAKDQATLDNARRDLARYQKLSKTGLISQQELDTQSSLVRQSEGSVKADQGAIDSAKLQLTYSRITAPISGRVGLKQVDVGNYITSGTATPIVVITQTHPVDVVFTLPESDIPAIIQAQKNAEKTHAIVPVEAWDRTNKQMLAQGYLLSIDNQIDTTTGTIKLKARFNNEDDVLFPNQFVNARIKVDLLQNAVVVPTAAVQMGSEGNFVWTLDDANKVSKHLVTTGIQNSQQVVIDAGLNAGQRVVTDGIDRLTEGVQVEVVTPRSANTDANPASAEKAAAEAEAAPRIKAEGVRPMRLHVAPRLRRNPDASDASNTRWRAVTAVYSAPVATTLFMIAILLAGIIGYRALPVSALPEVDYPTIQVVTLYPGASPDVVTSSITAPLERQFGQMSGLKQMASQSSGGASVITLQFQLTLPLDVAEQEVQAAINAATNLLPSDLPYPPIYNKVNPADPPILTLAVTATAIPMTQVEDMVETRIAQKISQVTGVGLVTLSGGQRPAVRVKLNAPAVAALGWTARPFAPPSVMPTSIPPKAVWMGQPVR